MKVELATRELRYRSPIHTAHQRLELRRVVIVRISHDGLVGFGEAAPMSGFDCETLDESVDAITSCTSTLRAMPAPSKRDDITNIVESVGLASRPCARSAIEAALCDLAARRNGKPLARFLCSAASAAVPLNALVRDADEARRAISEGFATLKTKIRDADDLVRVRSIRDAAPHARLRIDANGGIAPEALEPVVAALVALDPEYVEELTTPGPVPPGFAPRSVRTLRIAADESVARLDRDALIACADVAVLKPAVLGGPLSTLRLARDLEKQGVACTITSFLESSIGVRAALATAAALHGRSRARLAAGLATASLLENDLAEAPTIRNGAMVVDNVAGIGVPGLP